MGKKKPELITCVADQVMNTYILWEESPAATETVISPLILPLTPSAAFLLSPDFTSFTSLQYQAAAQSQNPLQDPALSIVRLLTDDRTYNREKELKSVSDQTIFHLSPHRFFGAEPYFL